MGANTFVSHDLDISKCMSSLSRRQGKEEETREGEGESALFFNVQIITSNTICTVQLHTRRAEDSPPWGARVNPLPPLICGS